MKEVMEEVAEPFIPLEVRIKTGEDLSFGNNQQSRSVSNDDEYEQDYFNVDDVVEQPSLCCR